MLSIAGVSVLSVKYIRLAGMRDCRMCRPFPTQAGDKPPRYTFLPPSGLRFFERRYQHGAMTRGSPTPHSLDSVPDRRPGTCVDCKFY